jgi:hypothetical protein
MQGNLQQISLNDLLLLATSGKKSGVLKLVRGKETVEVYLTDGTIVHATCPIGEGEKALLYPVTWSDGAFTLEPERSAVTTTIQKSSVELLSEIKSMTLEWETILELIPSGQSVFRLADLRDDQTGPITVPNVGWRVLSKLDGVRTIQEVAGVLRIPYAYVAKVMFNLHNAGLVEAVAPIEKPAVDVVPPALLARATALLTEVLGPMAPLVVRDQIKTLGASPTSLPEAKLDDLILLIGLEIGDPQLKKKFEQSMYQEIANFKRL